MAQSAEEQARYLQEALAIACGTTHASPEEFARLRALAQLLGEVVDALVWLEDAASSMPEHLYGQAGIHNAVMHARDIIHQADGFTLADEAQADAMREVEAEFGQEEDQP